MCFIKASEDHLPDNLIGLSDMPWAAAVVAAPMLKLCDLNCLGAEITQLQGSTQLLIKLGSCDRHAGAI